MTARPGARRRARLVAPVLAVAVLAAGCTRSEGATLSPPRSTTSSAAAEPTTSTATSAPSTTEVEDPPGSVFWQEQLDAGDLPGEVWKVLYRSRTAEDEVAVISGIVAVPDGDPPPGGFPVLAWAHGTTGIDDRCAPSRLGAGAVPFLREHLEAGYVVAATDYEGLGTPGIHPYLVAESEGRSVLDSVRAARHLLGPDVASDRFVVLGHSQGGHAALAAAERASSWTPELELVGTAALAPIADLELVIPELFESTIGLALGIYVAAGWPAAHPDLSPSDLLTPEGVGLLDRATGTCIGSMGDVVGGEDVDDLRVRRPTEVDRWAERIRENTIHAGAVQGPVLIAQGGRDGIVPPRLVDRLVRDLCAAGTPLRFFSHGTADHNTIVGASLASVHRWFALLEDGGPPPDSCGGR